ncbi:MAG: DciA family protein [Colwellia sp.]|nr:DciA family protein [Colwellia sp.]MCW8865984.1 DciA family protein [Colwellia sp.]MCW9082325.1 DciA family protein [Colwellia sp.]
MARRPKAPKDMSTLFNSTTGTLAQIKAKTNSLTQLCDIVRQICPDLPEDALNISNFIDNTLIIEVKSPVWGQRLQFERNNICRFLTEKTQGQFTQIEIKVNPYGHQQAAKKVSYARQAKTASAKSISNQTAKQLLEVAEHAPKGLKEKLEKLASIAHKKQ